MSGSINSVTLVGNMGSDAEVRTTAAGKMVATLSLATSRTWTDGQGERKESTQWHRVIVWGKQAEFAQRYLGKGRKICVEGSIEYRSWDDQQTGQKRYATEIQCEKLTALDSGAGGQRQDGQRGERKGGSQAPGGHRGPPNGPPDANAPFGYGPDGEVLDDDVPF